MSECIEHVGRKDKDGYGLIHFEGFQWRAHRLAWVRSKGAIPERLFVLHSCDNPGCVNVEHLRVGTCQDNHDDRKKRERSPYGTKTKLAKLTEDQVTWIKKLNRLGLMSNREIAKAFGISQGAIQHIVKGRTWPHVA